MARNILSNSEESSVKKHFSHVYVERDAMAFADCRTLLDRFPSAQVIEIGSYKEVFNRPHQHFQFQKQSMKLILAVKRDQFLYKGSALSPNFGQEQFFYNTMVINCIYNCDYCYLQGMYPSSNIVLFVNSDDFFAAVKKKLEEGRLYLCISYDTDLLAFEGLLQLCRRWITFAADKPALTIELRTKSANYRAISDVQALPNVILAWTLSPPVIASSYEKLTPQVEMRLRAVQDAIDDGWPVRLCIDPVLVVQDWHAVYGGFIDYVAEKVDLTRIHDFSVGSFRMNADYLSRIQGQRTDPDILFGQFERESGVLQYPGELRDEIVRLMTEKLAPLIGLERLHV